MRQENCQPAALRDTVSKTQKGKEKHILKTCYQKYTLTMKRYLHSKCVCAVSLIEEMSACIMPSLNKIRYHTYMLIHIRTIYLQGRGLLRHSASAHVSLLSCEYCVSVFIESHI